MLLLIGCLAATVIIFMIYKAALPKPIPGIPHNPGSDKSILGDVPEILASAKNTGETFNWLAAQTTRLGSPIVQVFARPFSKPWVIVTDFQESQDILLRRISEFDRSSFVADMLDGLVPHHHIHKLASDPTFNSNRNLIKDLMTPSFLNTVAAPQVYASVLYLIELWNVKLHSAKGRSFVATSDIFHCAFDIIFWATFGRRKNLSALIPQIELLRRTMPTVSQDHKDVVNFQEAPLPKEFEAIQRLSESIEAAVKSPLPRQTHWLLRQLPSMRRATRIKEQMLNEEIRCATSSFKPQMDRQKTCAMEEILWREYTASMKEGRAPEYSSLALRDELFGFLVAGVDTTSTSMAWALKFLADYPDVQTKLRDSLRQAYCEAFEQRRMPDFDEISKIQIAYLDSVMEEILRLMRTTGGLPRQALVDTEILGHKIPKGTDVFLMSNGASFWEPAMHIDRRLRQRSALDAKLQVSEWDPKTISHFLPERWLEIRDGKEVFNPLAGPTMNFGLGARACYGRRLAYLELRVMMVMIVWNFVLETSSQELSSYDAVEGITTQPQQCYVRLAKAM